MAQSVPNPSEQNYYFKDSVAYTEDHIPVQKIYIYGLAPQLNQEMLQAHFGMYGHVLRLQIFKSKNVQRRGRRILQNGYVFYAKKTDAAKALHSRVHHLNGLNFHVQASDSWHQPDAYGMPRYLPVYLPNTKPPPPPPVMSLNDHCLEHVMTYLALPDQMHFARTCLRFRAVYQAATARLHKFVNLSEFEEMTVWDMRDFFMLSGHHVEKIDGSMPSIHAQRFCDFLADSCRNLKTLNLLSNILSAYNMHKLFSKKPLLETVQLPMSNISDRSILELANLPKLKTLNLSSNPMVGDTIAELPSTIESLTLNDCTYLEVRNLLNILKTFHRLKELNIKDIDPNGVQIYEKLIKEKRCQALETLRMTGYSHIRYEFVAQMPKLKHLSVVIKQGVRKELFEQLATHKASQLECLEIFGTVVATKEVLLNITKLSELRSLTLPYIENDADLIDAFSRCNLQKLEKLVFRDISEQTILKVFGACRKISYIGLRDSTELTEELALGIVSLVRQEIANKDMQRKLPIQLCPYVNANKRLDLPKDIIQIRTTYNPNEISGTYFKGEFDDRDFDPDDLDLDDLEDSDDEDFENDEDFMGFFSDEDDEEEEFFLNGAGGYVHPSWPYDQDGEFIGFGLLDDD